MLSIILHLIIAGVLGFMIGMLSKSVYDQPFARIFSMICMASCLVTITSMGLFESLDLPWACDPGRLTSQVVSALGFLGTGFLWIGKDNKVRGLSVGAGLWFTAILGILLGTGMNQTAIIGFVFLIIIYCVSNHVEARKHDIEG